MEDKKRLIQKLRKVKDLLWKASTELNEASESMTNISRISDSEREDPKTRKHQFDEYSEKADLYREFAELMELIIQYLKTRDVGDDEITEIDKFVNEIDQML